MNDDFYILYALISSTGLLLAAASIAILRFQRKAIESDAFWESPVGAALQIDAQVKDTSASRERQQHLEERMAALQRIVDELSQREKATQLASAPRVLPFENAVRMAKQGASVEELTRSCGLNIGEAQLIRRLHGPTLN
ncbi:MAG: DUF2802 domain-containing protein [Gammaproteobacteria bacterium]|nr:DUF2802 domain-containing protein [Gammaproteobacteria bacterium]MDH5212922.1 DUF2802 domain-containing protein [Gammaproteobacteria bacterium]